MQDATKHPFLTLKKCVVLHYRDENYTLTVSKFLCHSNISFTMKAENNRSGDTFLEIRLIRKPV